MNDEENLRFLYRDQRERCQHCNIKFEQIMLV